jgi:hypothetical protein
LGRTDVVILLSPPIPLANATAAAIGNMIKEPGDVDG